MYKMKWNGFACEDITPEEWNLSLLLENLSKVLPAEGLASIKDTVDKTRIKAIVSEELQASFVKLDELTENQSIFDVMPKYLPSSLLTIIG